MFQKGNNIFKVAKSGSTFEMTTAPVFAGCPVPIWWTVSQSIISLICFILSIHIIYTLHRLIKNKSNETASKWSQKLAVILIISSFIILLQWSLRTIIITFCNGIYTTYYDITEVVFWIASSIQFYTLLSLYYDKLNNIFKSTHYELSKCTKRFYKIMFIIIPLWFITIILLQSLTSFPTKYPLIMSVIAAMGFFILILLMISMLILFLYKLIKVYHDALILMKDAKNTHKPIIAAITKVAILYFLSIADTFILLIASIFHEASGGKTLIGWYTWYLLNIFDNYFNFLYIIMCYKAFESYYESICKGLDKICRKCWKRIANRNTEFDDNDEVNLNEYISSRTTRVDRVNTSSSPNTPTIELPNTPTTDLPTPTSTIDMNIR